MILQRSRLQILIPFFFLSVLFSSQTFAEFLTRGPYLQMGTPQSIILRWRTDVATPSMVEYGTSVNNLSSTKTDLASTTEHEVILTGLTANTQYYYAIQNDTGEILTNDTGEILAGGDATHNFITAPTTGTVQPIRIWAIGDAGTANANAAAVYNAYLNHPQTQHTDLWLMLGDNAYNDGTDLEYQNAVFDMYPELLRNTVVWSTLGNHDGHSADSATQTGPYYDIFSLPTQAEAGGVMSGTEAYYSFDYGNIHFICLDSDESNRLVGGDMMNWLETDVAATTQDWVIAFWHHPPYTKGSHDSDSETDSGGAMKQMRENAVERLEFYGVDLVLSGHSHSYERSFLLDGHYDVSSTFDNAMKLDSGDGQVSSDGAYDKTTTPNNEGAVYIVAGSSGKISGGSLSHPAMHISLNSLGSVVLTVNGNQLDASFLDETGAELDNFTIVKGPDNSPPGLIIAEAKTVDTVDVTFTEPLEPINATNPLNYTIDQSGDVQSAVLSPDGRVVTLTTPQLTEGLTYTLTVNNILDLNSNSIAPDSQIAFTYTNLISIAFQDGVNEYAGTADTYLSQNSPSALFGTTTSLLVDGDDPSDTTNDLSSMVRWDVSAIPSSAIIQMAELSLEVFNVSSNSYPIYEMKKNWVENNATWNEFASGQSWETAGGQGPGDRGSLVLGTVNPTSTGTHNVLLNSDGINLVQAWVDGSMTNNGIIIANANASNGADFRSREYGSGHPKIIVTYSLPSNNSDTVAPSIPLNLQTDSVTENSVALSWDVSTDNVAVVGYEIFGDGLSVGSSNTNSFVVTGLQANTSYDFEVNAFDAVPNTSGLSSTLTETTLAIASSHHVDDILMSLSQQGKKWITASSRVRIVDDSGSPLANATVSGAWSGLINQSVSDLTLADGSFTFTAPKVSQNTSGEFTFTVDDVSLSGYNYLESNNVETSDCIDTSGLSCQPSSGGLLAPTGLTSSYDNVSAVDLSWNSVAQATSYNIYRSTVSGSGFTWLESNIQTPYQDTSVSIDTDYYYAVTAVNATDESSDSNETHVYTGTTQDIILHTDSVFVTLKQKGNKWSASANIVVVNASNNQAVVNATISGMWSLNGTDIENDNATTDGAGVASVQTSRYIASTGGLFRFTVTNITSNNASYDNNNVFGEAMVP